MKIFTQVRSVALFVVLMGIVFLGFQCPQPAIIVEAGWDLWYTKPGGGIVNIEGREVKFNGVPLDTYDFGGVIGEQDVGATDTIVERLEVAEVQEAGEADTIPIELIALQLKSVEPIEPGGDVFLYATLNEAISSLGTMTITFDDETGGTFDSSFTVNFDIRVGSLTGEIVFSDALTLTADNVRWEREPEGEDIVQIEGVNVFLNGNNRDADFWPREAEHRHEDFANPAHIVEPAHDQGRAQ